MLHKLDAPRLLIPILPLFHITGIILLPRSTISKGYGFCCRLETCDHTSHDESHQSDKDVRHNIAPFVFEDICIIPDGPESLGMLE